MDEMKELIEEVLIRMQRRYREMLEVERLTKELADTLSSGDRESVHLLLNMRQQQIEKVGDIDYALQELLGILDSEKRKYVANLMNGKKQFGQNSEEERKIVQMAEQTSRVLEKTISIDKVLSRKLAGKDSYYQ